MWTKVDYLCSCLQLWILGIKAFDYVRSQLTVMTVDYVLRKLYLIHTVLSIITQPTRVPKNTYPVRTE